MKNIIQTSIDTNLRLLDEIRKSNYNDAWTEGFIDLYIEQKQALKGLLKAQHTSSKPREDIDKKIEIEVLVDEAFQAHKNQ